MRQKFINTDGIEMKLTEQGSAHMAPEVSKCAGKLFNFRF